MSEQSSQEAISEIWQLFKETDAKFKETDAKFKETDARFQATDVRLDRRFAETDANLRRLEGMFTSQWGRMLEALVQPAAIRLFRERGIDVHRISPRAKSQRNGETMEVDLLLENGTDIVVVEVKSMLKVADVQDFLHDLREFPRFFSLHGARHIYGAVAGLTIVEDADRYAYRQGLFVLNVSGDNMVRILNDTNFRPRNFGQEFSA